MLQIIGVKSILGIYRIEVILGRRLRYEARIFRVYTSKGLYYLDKLVVVAHNVEIFIIL